MTILNKIDTIVDVLKNSNERGVKCNLLIGAGCSATAEIPTASGIIDIIKVKFPAIYSTVEDKTYANCMNALSPNERMDLIKSLVNNSKLNITHIIIAELIKKGYIDRVLTPNFDNLLIKSCSIINEYPPIYDLAAYDEFRPDHIPEKCIFYLHGQFTGLKIMNTTEEVTIQAKKLKELFQRLNERSVWIIVGFSGLNDALFKLLSEEKVYSNRLFWIGHNDEEPHEELKKHILKKEKYGFYIKGYDSDGFFWNLANRLNCFPPTFLMHPFSYIKNIVDQIVPYQPSPNLDFSKATNTIIEEAINKYEQDPVFLADSYYNFGLYDNVINMEDILLKKKKKVTLSNSYFHKARKVYNDAENIEEYLNAIELYSKSNNLREYHGSYNNIGLCYFELAALIPEKRDEYLIKGLENYVLSIDKGNEALAFTNANDLLLEFFENCEKLSKKTKGIILKQLSEIYENKLTGNEIAFFKRNLEVLSIVIEELDQIDGLVELKDFIKKVSVASKNRLEKYSLQETAN